MASSGLSLVAVLLNLYLCRASLSRYGYVGVNKITLVCYMKREFLVQKHSPRRGFWFSVFSFSYMTSPQILKYTENNGKFKFEKGSLCHIMCSSERFCDISDTQGASKRGNLECSSAINIQHTAI